SPERPLRHRAPTGPTPRRTPGVGTRAGPGRAPAPRLPARFGPAPPGDGTDLRPSPRAGRSVVAHPDRIPPPPDNRSLRPSRPPASALRGAGHLVGRRFSRGPPAGPDVAPGQVGQGRERGIEGHHGRGPASAVPPGQRVLAEVTVGPA